MTLPVRQSDLHFLDAVTKLVVDSVASPHSKRAYRDAIAQFLAWCRSQGPEMRPLTKATVTAYRAHMDESGRSGGTINTHLAAIRKLAIEAADNGFLGRDGGQIAEAIQRVKGARVLGVRTGNWFTAAQANQLLMAPDQTRLKGIRDVAILAVLLGCGLRRAELCELKLERIQQRDGRWVIVDMAGKGGRVRTVPMPAWVKAAVDAWVDSKEKAWSGQNEQIIPVVTVARDAL